MQEIAVNLPLGRNKIKWKEAEGYDNLKAEIDVSEAPSTLSE